MQVVYPALDSKVKNVTLAYSVEHEDEVRASLGVGRTEPCCTLQRQLVACWTALPTALTCRLLLPALEQQSEQLLWQQVIIDLLNLLTLRCFSAAGAPV